MVGRRRIEAAGEWAGVTGVEANAVNALRSRGAEGLDSGGEGEEEAGRVGDRARLVVGVGEPESEEGRESISIVGISGSEWSSLSRSAS